MRSFVVEACRIPSHVIVTQFSSRLNNSTLINNSIFKKLITFVSRNIIVLFGKQRSVTVLQKGRKCSPHQSKLIKLADRVKKTFLTYRTIL